MSKAEELDQIQNKMQTHNKKLLWLHRLAVFVFVGVLFFIDRHLAKSFFAFSLVFNVYLTMLTVSFFPFNVRALKGADANPLKPIPIFISFVRVILAAALLALLVLYFKLSLLGLMIAFLLYQFILISSGFIKS